MIFIFCIYLEDQTNDFHTHPFLQWRHQGILQGLERIQWHQPLGQSHDPMYLRQKLRRLYAWLRHWNPLFLWLKMQWWQMLMLAYFYTHCTLVFFLDWLFSYLIVYMISHLHYPKEIIILTFLFCSWIMQMNNSITVFRTSRVVSVEKALLVDVIGSK